MHSHSQGSSDKHSHDHTGHEHHDASTTDFANVNTSFMIAVGANLGFTVIEGVYGFITDSVALLGDAGHNLSDVLGLLLAWGAAYLVTRKSSDAYSYGYRRTTILAAMTNAIVLVFAASYIAYESIEKFFVLSPIGAEVVMIVAALGILVNAGTALLFMRGSKHDLNLRGAYLHLAYDAGISAAVVVGAAIIHFTQWLWIDPVLGLLIVGVILMGTWGLLRDSVNLILDAVPQGIEPSRVKQYLQTIEGVTEVHDMHIWGMSTRENCLTAHLVMPENTLWCSEDSYTRIGKTLLEEYNIHHITLQVEKAPDCSNNDCH
ncbi:MAG: cation diffusion facilitator family transporter [Pseudomonadales bacterium]|nr:cation diffusion facilitator family transporter [Pseudomonadales bacterium]